MPFALAIIGIAIFVTAVRGTTSTLFGLIRDDFQGSGNFIYWIVSLLVIGSLGYVKRLQPFANGFLALVMVVLFIGAGRNGFFLKFMDAITSPASNCGTPANDNIVISNGDEGPVNNLGPANGVANGIIQAPEHAIDWLSLGLASGKGGNTGSYNLLNQFQNFFNSFKPQSQNQGN